jgi:hypothetical protein
MSPRKQKTTVSPPEAETQPVEPLKLWGKKKNDPLDSVLTRNVLKDLYESANSLDKDTRQRLGLMMKIPVFIQDPLVAIEKPLLGIQEIEVRLEKGFDSGPTSSRVVVVDFNADTQRLQDPVEWIEENGWFRSPLKEWLPDAPRDLTDVKRLERYQAEYEAFITSAVKNPFFHQVNAWAVVQRVLEFYEHPQALGRPVPWGFDGNRLIVVPHAGYGENAFYDRATKSLQFFYFGDPENPGYTCLSHDIIAHETGHAVLDGIRPLYIENPSVQTAAFHEFIGDLTAILLSLHNRDIRHFIANLTDAKLEKAKELAQIAEQFGKEVEDREYLRTAHNTLTLKDPKVKDSMSAHNVSQVLTGAMFDILIGIANKHMEKNLVGTDTQETVGASLQADSETEAPKGEESSPNSPKTTQPPRKVSPKQALWWSAERFRRVALQPLDLCPPCDIQFIDYAKAVIRNDVLSNPVDPEGYRSVMLDAFHKRGLCECDYKSGEDLPENCEFQVVLYDNELTSVAREFINHDINRVSRSRTQAYYFLSDNRQALRIPVDQDIQVSDLYGNHKLGAIAERMPAQVVLEYTWKELIPLRNDPSKGFDFGKMNGKFIELFCGGTLVFDERGNLLSWFRKPGIGHFKESELQDLKIRIKAWDENPTKARQDKLKKPIKLELAALADYEIGQQRVNDLLSQYARKLKKGLVGLADENNSGIPPVLQKPLTAVVEKDVVHFTSTPHLRKEDLDTEEKKWLINY